MILCHIVPIPIKSPNENGENPLPNPVTFKVSGVTLTGYVVSTHRMGDSTVLERRYT